MSADEIDTEPNTEQLFGLIWNELVDVLGSSATAGLLRRAAKQVAAREPVLGELVIRRPAFEYEYIVPARWKNDGRESLTALVSSLLPLLEELTGSIMISRLRSIPELARAGLLCSQKESAS